MKKTRLGIDLGGTKIEIIALGEQGAELYRRRVPTPQGDYHKTIQTLFQLVSQAKEELLRIDKSLSFSIGIGTPGALTPKNVLKNSNSVCLIGKPIKEDLERLLGEPIRLANDANCFALSEAVDGAGQGAGIVFGVILGTGVGGGVVFDGKVVNGANSIAGEWGHNPLPWPQPWELPGILCYCGKKGCIETFLSGPGLERDAELGVSAGELLALAENGNEKAANSLNRYEDRLARGLASVINVLDPDVIVLGGGVSNLQRLYTNVPQIWGRYIFSSEGKTQLKKAKHGDSSGVRGAAWLWA